MKDNKKDYRMELILDNIIFSLQHAGGVSVVWVEHIKRLLKDPLFNSSFIEYSNATNNVNRQSVSIPKEKLSFESKKYLFIKRYLNINSNCEGFHIFHSSYYRIDLNPNAKNVTTVHDFVYERYMRGLQKTVHSYQKWKAIRKADAIICISESTKKDLLRYLPDVDENKINIVYNGVNEIYKKMDYKDYRLRLPFSTKEYALYVGSRKVKYKNFITAVNICKETKTPLIIVGGEPCFENEIKFLREQLGEGHFAIYGNASNGDLNELYNRAFVLLYPSLYEGFGLPVVEAQRCGCPVLCIASSSIPEIAGTTNLCVPKDSNLFEICSLIRELRNNTEFRLKEEEQGLMNSQRFSWDKTYQQTTEVYRKLTS